MELGVVGSLLFDVFTLTDSLLPLELIRMDGVGLC